MKVTVVGKEHMSGTSKKSGKEYSNTIAHITYKKNGLDGLAADTVWLDDKTYPLASIQVGKTYDLDRDGRGFVIGFELV